MAENNATPNNDVLSANDPLDINELASLNEEISNEFIDQLQNQISASSNIKNDGDLFEETSGSEHKSTTFNSDIDDNFIKKYKAKLKKRQGGGSEEENYDLKSRSAQDAKGDGESAEKTAVSDSVKNEEPGASAPGEGVTVEKQEAPAEIQQSVKKDSIEVVSGGNIVEKPLTQEAEEYKESLDLLDNNVKYSKYVIYIDPENKDFIDSLTVKERKNLINKIIKEQDSIAITKRRFSNMQTILAHSIIAIMTIAIAIPCIYWTINASLEATINNYRASQVVFGTLYKEHGKIKTKSNNIR